MIICFFKKIKKLNILLLLTYIIMPLNVFAYSNRIIASGKNIGINLHSKGILIVGTYEVNGNYPALAAGLKSGDTITSIDNIEVNSIDDLAERINESNNNEIDVKYLRGGKSKTTKLKLYRDENNIYKTGLFVKDSMVGIGTLTFIDPNTKMFGALGHEMQEQTIRQIFDMKDGKIYDSIVTGLVPSENGNPGEKKAVYNFDDEIGVVSKNTMSGVFGEYTADIDGSKTYEVALPEEVVDGEAQILTVLDGKEIKKYSINITRINSMTDKTQNFMFEITDSELLNKAGGIIQGMSGSPIIRDDKILGAVTHVVINDTTKGYGIFITNMLEEAEK